MSESQNQKAKIICTMTLIPQYLSIFQHFRFGSPTQPYFLKIEIKTYEIRVSFEQKSIDCCVFARQIVLLCDFKIVIGIRSRRHRWTRTRTRWRRENFAKSDLSFRFDVDLRGCYHHLKNKFNANIFTLVNWGWPKYTLNPQLFIDPVGIQPKIWIMEPFS